MVIAATFIHFTLTTINNTPATSAPDKPTLHAMGNFGQMINQKNHCFNPLNEFAVFC